MRVFVTNIVWPIAFTFFFVIVGTKTKAIKVSSGDGTSTRSTIAANRNDDNGIAADNGEDDRLIQKSLDDISSMMQEHHDEMGRCKHPFVTLAYAQSIDGKIALTSPSNKEEKNNGAPSEQNNTETSSPLVSSNFAISGPESLRLTHGLR